MYDSDICSIEVCDRPRASRGFCHQHYKRWLSNPAYMQKTPIRSVVRGEHPKCLDADCELDSYKKGMCNKHYQRQYRKYMKLRKSSV